MKKYLLPLLFLLLLTGCSSRKYFEPQNVQGEVSFDGEIPAPITDVTREGATLADGHFITKSGVVDLKLPKGFHFINESEGAYIASHPCGKVKVYDVKSKKLVWESDFKKRSVVAASKKGDLLAMVFDDDTLMILDIAHNKRLYSSKQSVDMAVDTKIADPYFLGNLVIFPTLDGKLVVVDSKSGKELRTLIVGTKKFFNNVIFLDVIENKLIAATPNKIISVSPQATNSLDIEIGDVLYVKDAVYILAKDGRVLLCDPDLDVLKTRKYPFAHFTGAIYGEYIYIIEKEGYIIALDKELRVSNIFRFPSAIEEYIFTSKDTVYYDDRYFKLKKL